MELKNGALTTIHEEYIVLIGGRAGAGDYLDSCDYLAASNLLVGWRPMTPLLVKQESSVAIAMPPRGRILVMGGHTPIKVSDTIDLYTPDPTSAADWSPKGQWTTVLSQVNCMRRPRYFAELKGTVMIIGELIIDLNYRT